MKRKTKWLVPICSIVVALSLVSCGTAAEEEVVVPPEEEEIVTEEEVVAPPPEEEEIVVEEEEEAPPPEEEEVTEEEEAAQLEEEEVAPPTDTTPPSAITGLIAVDAYDGKVNLWWDVSTAEDFDHYNIYSAESAIVDVTGITPVHEVGDLTNISYQVTGLELETGYYFAVTAVDRSGNESTLVASVSVIPTPMPRGTLDPDICVDVYEPDMVWAGTTLLSDCHNLERVRIIEVNMLGEIVWEYLVPEKGFVEAELLSNNNILYTVDGKGVYEIDRNGKIVWSYLTNKIDHDADRLPNGNTIFVFGSDDQKSDAQVTEVNPEGEIVWSWYAKDHFNKAPYKDIYLQGWVHTNAVTRLPNGNTLISLRNFNFVVEVDPEGSVVRTIGEGIYHRQHDPEMLPGGNILVADHSKPQRAVEIDPETGEIVWQFAVPRQLIRDADRLPNGNTLITGATKIIEVTPQGKIVWQLKLENVTLGPAGLEEQLYKAERIAPYFT